MKHLHNNVEPTFLFRSQSTRRRFLQTKGLWKTIVAFIASQIPNILLLSDKPYLVSWLEILRQQQPKIFLLISMFSFAMILSVVVYKYWKLRSNQIQTEASLRDFSQSTSELIRKVRRTKLDTICKSLCVSAQQVFAARLADQGIGCAIRLRGDNGFETVARAGRLSQAREMSTTPVSFDGTLARLLESDEARRSAIIICPDVEMAHSAQQLERDANSERPEFADQIKSMMLARIISFDSDGVAELAGIFYVTSDKVNGLTEDLTDLMVTVSMMVSEAIREKLDTPSMTSAQFEILIKRMGDGRTSSVGHYRTVRGEKNASKQRRKSTG